MTGRTGLSTIAAGTSLALAVAASTALVLLPTTTSVSTTSSSAGSPSPTTVTHQTLLQHEGSGVLVVLAVPVLVAALGAAVRAARGRRAARVFSAFLLCAFSVMGAASVGLFYAPAAVAMAAAAFSGTETTK
jgi:hypothetical protein